MASSTVAYVGGEGLLVVAEAAAVLLFTAISTATVVTLHLFAASIGQAALMVAVAIASARRPSLTSR